MFPSPVRNPCLLLWDENAIAKLQELSLHKVYARHVKSIRFSKMTLEKYNSVMATERWGYGAASKPSRAQRVAKREKRLHQERMHHKLKHSEIEFLNDRLVSSIVEALGALKQAGKAPTIVVRQGKGAETPWG